MMTGQGNINLNTIKVHYIYIVFEPESHEAVNPRRRLSNYSFHQQFSRKCK